MTGDVQGVLVAVAETGGTGEGAVAARKTALGHLIPVGVFIVVVEEILETSGCQFALLVSGRFVHQA